MSTDEAIKIVAEFDGWCHEATIGGLNVMFREGEGYKEVDDLKAEYETRDAIIEAAKKLPEDWQDVLVHKLIEACGDPTVIKFMWFAVTVEPETMLLALAETITEMKGEK